MYIVYFEGDIAKLFKDCPVRITDSFEHALEFVAVATLNLGIEDDRVSIFKSNGLGIPELVWEFFGWHFRERIGQGTLIDRDKTLYEELAEALNEGDD